MYMVYWHKDYKDDIGEVIHFHDERPLKLIDGKIRKSLNSIDIFEFTAPINNPCYGKLIPLVSMVRVHNILTGALEFEGRVAEIEELKMSSSGLFSEKVKCEDTLAYLHDSSQRWRDVKLDNIDYYFRQIIDRHNASVPEHKRFKKGRVTVTSGTGNVYRGIGYEDTFETIRDKLINRLGGYIIKRKEPDGYYLDYLKDYGEDSDTPIRISLNMVEASKNVKVDELATRIIPLGAEIEKKDTGNANSILARERHSIRDVNGGNDYLDDEKLIQQFGLIEKSVFFDGVSDHNVLKNRGQNYLRDQRTSLVTWKTTVVDISQLDNRFEQFQVGNKHPIQNQLLSGEERLQIVEKTIDINHPEKVELTVGTGFQTLSAFQLQYREIATSLSEAKREFDRNKKTITELLEEKEKIQEELQKFGKISEDQKRRLEQIEKELEQSKKEKEQQKEKLKELIEQRKTIETKIQQLDPKSEDFEEQQRRLTGQLREIQHRIDELMLI